MGVCSSQIISDGWVHDISAALSVCGHTGLWRHTVCGAVMVGAEVVSDLMSSHKHDLQLWNGFSAAQASVEAGVDNRVP